MRRSISILSIAVAVACAADPSPAPKPAPRSVGLTDAGTPSESPEPDAGASPDAPAPLPEVPRGVASFEVHVPRGSRQPLTLVGTIAEIGPAPPDAGLSAWTEVALSAASADRERFYVLAAPESFKLPFSRGDRLAVEIDCRKGGWHRVCDAVVRDARRRTIVIAAASGDHRLAPGWKIERGPVATSEHRRGSEKSIEHTHALLISRDGRSLSVAPHAWHRFELRGESWLVQGYEVVWEGARPPDARDHRAFALVRER